MVLPSFAKIGLFVLMGAVWLFLFRRANRLEQGKAFHVAAHQRDQRKARLYYRSVWVGLTVATLSMLCLQVLAEQAFDSRLQREWTFNLISGMGLWGLFILAAVWSQVGQRVSQPNSDGQSLLPSPEPHNDRLAR
jgi:hypothetical protein